MIASLYYYDTCYDYFYITLYIYIYIVFLIFVKKLGKGGMGPDSFHFALLNPLWVGVWAIDVWLPVFAFQRSHYCMCNLK